MTAEPSPGPEPAAAVVIRRPAGREIAACRLLLPDAFAHGIAPEALIALSPEPHRVLGAAALRAVIDGGRFGWTVDLHVVAPRRRQGIGRALMTAAIERADRRGLAALEATHGLATRATAVPFLAAMGFRPTRRLVDWEADLATYAALLAPIADRLRARRALPATARVAPLDAAPAAEVLALWARHLGDGRTPADPRLAAAMLARVTNAASTVLLEDGRVRGLHLVEIAGEVATIHARVVAPGRRGGAANLLMMMRSIETGLAMGGVHRIRFTAADDNADTMKLARRAGAVLVAERAGWRREIAAPAIPPRSDSRACRLSRS